MELPQQTLNTNSNIYEPNDLMRTFTSMLTNFNENIWTDVGKAFYYESSGTLDGLLEWKKYTETVSNNSSLKDLCETKYPNFNNSKITHKTIAWHAKINAPESYNLWHRKWIDEAIQKCLEDPEIINLSELFYRKFWLNMAYCSKKTYLFSENTNHWKYLCDGKSSIRRLLFDEILIEFENKEKEMIQDCVHFKMDIEMDIDTFTLYMKNIMKIKNKIYKNIALLKEIQTKFAIEEFEKMIDSNLHIIGVSNGLLEMDHRSAIFRSGKPEDYVMKHISIRYREDFHMDHEEVKKYMKYLDEVFPDKELMNHMRLDIASFLRWNNLEKLIRVIYGRSDSSKTVFVNMIHEAFGPYCGNFSFSLLKKGIQDPNFRVITSWDLDINSRFETCIFGQNHKLLLVIDDNQQLLKYLKVNNGIVQRRLKIIPFLSHFVDDCPESEQEQYESRTFRKDKRFHESIHSLSEAMLWCAVQDYSSYCQHGLIEPQLIRDEINKYWNV
jgi:hypothetical protein